MDHLRQKEEELLRINQELEAKRIQLKQDYMNYKQQDSESDQQQDDEYQGSEDDYNDLYHDDEDNMMDQIVKNVKEKELHQLNKQQQFIQGGVKYEDKQSEALEIDLHVDDQTKQVRVQNLQIEALKQDLEAIMSQNKLKENLISEIEAKGKNLQDQTKKFTAQITVLNNNIESYKQRQIELQSKQKILDKENTTLVKQIEAVKKEYRQRDSDGNKLDIKINRIMDELTKIKSTYLQQKSAQSANNSDLNNNITQIKNENTKIEQQISETLSNLKKQLKLIDILKKQRIHIIGARVFQFLESDFQKTVNLKK